MGVSASGVTNFNLNFDHMTLTATSNNKLKYAIYTVFILQIGYPYIPYRVPYGTDLDCEILYCNIPVSIKIKIL